MPRLVSLLLAASPSPALAADATTGRRRPQAPPPKLPDACTLLTRAEAAAVLQLKVQAPDDYGTNCSYVADFNGPSGQLQIFLDTTTPRALRIDRRLHHKFWTVRGIGDQAFE